MNRCWSLAAAFCIALMTAAALANDIVTRNVLLAPTDDAYVLSADFDVTLGERLERALNEGVPLYFTFEFECTRPRWYWFDERVVTKKHQARLSFHALTRTYRLSTGALHQTFASADEAVHALGIVRGWRVLPMADLAPDSDYVAGVRMALDVDQLPKPFQVSALTNRDWTLAAPWIRWIFTTDGDGRIAP